MKKRVIMLGLSLSLSLMTLAGCGFGDSYKTEAAAENEVSTHSEPTEEILSADFTDFKFQGDDVLFQPNKLCNCHFNLGLKYNICYL